MKKNDKIQKVKEKGKNDKIQKAKKKNDKIDKPQKWRKMTMDKLLHKYFWNFNFIKIFTHYNYN